MKWFASLFGGRRRETHLIYPFRGLLDAMESKDPDLFRVVGPMSPSEACQVWKSVYPEDFPQGGMSLPHESSIVPRRLNG